MASIAHKQCNFISFCYICNPVNRHVPRDNMSFGRKGREGFCPSHEGNRIIRMFCNFIHHRYTAKLVTNSHCIIRKWIKLNPLQSPKSVALLLQGRTHVGRNSGGKSHLGIWAQLCPQLNSAKILKREKRGIK